MLTLDSEGKALDFSLRKEKISPEDFQDIPPKHIGTVITLSDVRKSNFRDILAGRSIEKVYSSKTLKQELVSSHLVRFIGLRDIIGKFSIELKSSVATVGGGDAVAGTAFITEQDIPEPCRSKPLIVRAMERHGAAKVFRLRYDYFRISENTNWARKNFLALCANSAVVEDFSNDYFKSKTLENNPIDNNYHFLLVSGDFLDAYVNEQRDGFNLAESDEDVDLILPSLSQERILERAFDIATLLVAPPEWDSDKLVSEVESKFRLDSTALDEARVRIHYGDTTESVAKRALKNFQDQVVEGTSEMLTLAEEADGLDPTSAEYADLAEKIAWTYSSKLSPLETSSLSQLVVRRALVIEVLRKAVKHQLKIQEDAVTDGKRKSNESIIHNIIFPMKIDSHALKRHDLWLLNEEYHLYDYIASDLKFTSMDKLKQVPYLNEELPEVMKLEYEKRKNKAPDIALFKDNGSAVILELKAPGVSLDFHTSSLVNYARIIYCMSGGKINRFYCYLIGDTLDGFNMEGWDPLPSEDGWFRTQSEIIPGLPGKTLSFHGRVLFYDDLVDSANARLSVFKDRLSSL